MNLKWKTMQKLNVKRTDHTWKIKLVGEPEFKYVEELIKFLNNNEFVYRITNQTVKNSYKQWHIVPYIDPMLLDYSNIFPHTIDRYGHNHLAMRATGEILAEQYETISIMVYKNTTQLRVVDRKEVK